MNPPKPTALKLLEGNLGKRPLNEFEPKPEKGIPPIPEWLDEIAKKKWDELSPYLFDLGLLTIIDGDMLAATCSIFSWIQRNEQELKKRRTKRKGLITELQGWYKLWKGYLGEFGLSPAQRSRIGVAPKTIGKKGTGQYLT